MDSGIQPVSRGGAVKLQQLLGLSLEPLTRRIRRMSLEARLRSLQGLVDYFEWQAANAREGLADTHKRMTHTSA